MTGRVCMALMGFALVVASSGCDSPPTGPPPASSVDASGKPTAEALEKAKPPKGFKGGGAPILPGR
ncbi:hypothetical protein [Paludisphaera mucosa]|uniref:Lipoprotein n=1 Tax=Paludisphaera mucosa TaxID=3030827 RepID=A0ABT6FFC8_9BACT|nr:hypothetical protein [Paludisphaera mucosa]MDG3006103.1 hypothetical protein [Paludisphaera mucosa]